MNSSYPSPFRASWHDTPAGLVLRSSALEGFTRHGFTTRHLRFREPTLDEDYDRLGRAFGVPAEAVVRVRQVHGRVVHVAPSVVGGDPVDADAVVVTHPRLVASVRVADCVPLLLADRTGRVVAAVHAGWRGTAAGVAAETVRVIESLGVEPTALVAVIGPSIGPCCYQVGPDVRDAMGACWDQVDRWFVPDERRWRLDLWQANRDQLESAGVPGDQIHVTALCTAHDLAHWYSHRQEGAETGRIVAAIAATRA